MVSVFPKELKAYRTAQKDLKRDRGNALEEEMKMMESAFY